MRKRLVASAIAVAAVGALVTPAAAHAEPAHPNAVSVLRHGSKAGTAVVSGRNEPGTRLSVGGVDTASAHTLPVDYQVQETGYWCGPPPLASRSPHASPRPARATLPRSSAPPRPAPITSAR